MGDFSEKMRRIGGQVEKKIQQFPANKLKEITCECGCVCWEPAAIWKMIPAEAAMDGKEHISDMPVMANRCMDCGKLMPKDAKEILYPKEKKD